MVRFISVLDETERRYFPMADHARKETGAVPEYSNIRVSSDLIETIKRKLGE
jgi:hypothetical protein